MGKGVNHIRSKWLKTKALLKDGGMRRYVPVTKIMSPEALSVMLRDYGMVYVKPSSGTYGSGVMRVDRATVGGAARYRYQTGKEIRSFGSFGELYRSLLKRKKKRTYLAQQGIRLLKHQGRPFDVRVMVQRDRSRNWETTAIIARVAERGKIVTNYHSGGKPTPLDRLLSPRIGAAGARRSLGLLSDIGRRAAVALSRTYPRIDSVGADIGLDTRNRPWIIELNTKPDPYIFKHLNNRNTYKKVLRYAKALGRI